MSRAVTLEVTIAAATGLVVPTTAMVATGHTLIAAGTISAALASLLVVAAIRTRAATERHRETLAYAHTATSLGADPSTVIKAMHEPDDPVERSAEAGRTDNDSGDIPAGVHWPPGRR